MVNRCTGPELTAAQLYELLVLRSEVFVVEQRCPYLDPDGLDLLASTEHRWSTDDAGRVVAALRVLDDPERPGARRIGRVVCRPEARGGGEASALVVAAADDIPREITVTLHAQSHLASWYRSLGFEVDGSDYVEDGIAHTPMRRREHG
jgi:ElaA protein